ncbi:eco57I restriction-modification methylase family protein [Collimonas fungivorans]|uniref:site-specific DNA-methyltransferase (adenine-specific) n=2 Tax=Collimonas fungivorans TaxID=158899 RepID=A0A127P4Y5_9BURK|nr:eco57I restriction-modification methylase family protein [Collimonas fungivorans]
MPRDALVSKRQSRNQERAEFYKHVRNIASHVISDALNCGTVAETLVVSWSRRIFADFSPGELQNAHQVATNIHILSFLAWLETKEMLDSAYWISSAYSIWMGKKYRKSYAMFFTPPSLTKRMLDDLETAGISFAENSFFDPACGGAAFLAPVAQRMKNSLYARGKTSLEILKHIELNLFGTDLDPILCRISQFFLRMVLANEILSENYEPIFHISSANSLTSVSPMFAKIDVVVCNPPYRKLTTDEIHLYQNEFSSVMQHQPNLYGLFIALCLELVKESGIVSLITPMSYLSGKSFSKLRHFLLSRSQILRIGVVSERSGVFIDVEQETALTLLKRSLKGQIEASNVEISVIHENGENHTIGRSILPGDGLTWPIPRRAEDVAILADAFASPFRIRDYGYIARVGSFVWNRDKRSTFFTLQQAINALAKKAIPLLWSSDIEQGGTVQFLNCTKHNDEPAFVDMSDPNHRSIVRNPAVLLQRVTSNDQSRRLVTACVPNDITAQFGGFIGENHVVILEATSPTPIVSTETLTQLFSSALIDRNFRCISGATNVSIFELNQLPLPSPIYLTRFLKEGMEMETAINTAFRLSSSLTDVGNLTVER